MFFTFITNIADFRGAFASLCVGKRYSYNTEDTQAKKAIPNISTPSDLQTTNATIDKIPDGSRIFRVLDISYSNESLNKIAEGPDAERRDAKVESDVYNDIEEQGEEYQQETYDTIHEHVDMPAASIGSEYDTTVNVAKKTAAYKSIRVPSNYDTTMKRAHTDRPNYRTSSDYDTTVNLGTPGQDISDSCTYDRMITGPTLFPLGGDGDVYNVTVSEHSISKPAELSEDVDPYNHLAIHRGTHDEVEYNTTVKIKEIVGNPNYSKLNAKW